jgi:hypothetical protein
MGNSASASLVFGYRVLRDGKTYEFPPIWRRIDREFSGDFDDFILHVEGKTSLSWDEKRAIINVCPAKHHASGLLYESEADDMIVMRGVGAHCSWDKPEQVPTGVMNLSPERIAEFVAWCRRAGFEFDVEPAWFITAGYG